MRYAHNTPNVVKAMVASTNILSLGIVASHNDLYDALGLNDRPDIIFKCNENDVTIATNTNNIIAGIYPVFAIADGNPNIPAPMTVLHRLKTDDGIDAVPISLSSDGRTKPASYSSLIRCRFSDADTG